MLFPHFRLPFPFNTTLNVQIGDGAGGTQEYECQLDARKDFLCGGSLGSGTLTQGALLWRALGTGQPSICLVCFGRNLSEALGGITKTAANSFFSLTIPRSGTHN